MEDDKWLNIITKYMLKVLSLVLLATVIVVFFTDGIYSSIATSLLCIPMWLLCLLDLKYGWMSWLS